MALLADELGQRPAQEVAAHPALRPAGGCFVGGEVLLGGEPGAAIVVGGASGILALLVGLVWMITSHDLRLRRRGIRFYLSHDRSTRFTSEQDLAADEAAARRS